jgi:hypothetical protein
LSEGAFPYCRRAHFPSRPGGGAARSHHPFSFKSFGETVQVEVSGANGDIRVQVKSASRLPTTLVDWGTNDDIRRFGDWLTKTA